MSFELYTASEHVQIITSVVPIQKIPRVVLRFIQQHVHIKLFQTKQSFLPLL